MRPLAIAVLVFASLSFGGCVTIQPWERERLARTDMQFGGSEELSGGESHATEVREGSSGGFDAGGGGCGCN